MSLHSHPIVMFGMRVGMPKYSTICPMPIAFMLQKEIVGNVVYFFRIR